MGGVTLNKRYHAWQKILIAIAFFGLVYSFHISDTSIGRLFSNEVRWVMDWQIDGGAVLQMAQSYVPTQWRQWLDRDQALPASLIQYVSQTLSKPASPLAHLNKPLEGWLREDSQRPENIRITAPAGASVRSAAAGTIRTIDEAHKSILIDHGQGLETQYTGLSEILVKINEKVGSGQVVGRLGRHIDTKGILTFQVRQQGQPVDPLERVRGDFPPEGK